MENKENDNISQSDQEIFSHSIFDLSDNIEIISNKDISNVNTDESNNNSFIYSNVNVNNLTLEYFSNSGVYNRYLNKSNIEKNITNSDKKFYKKRIVDLTKKMLKGDFENDILKDSFNKYIFSLITHFKMMDTTEIIQKKFELSKSNIPDISDISCISIDDISYSYHNELLFKKDAKVLTMDNFITKKIKEKEPTVFPLKKNINLREPEFKIKGIKKKVKKENIDNV